MRMVQLILIVASMAVANATLAAGSQLPAGIQMYPAPTIPNQVSPNQVSPNQSVEPQAAAALQNGASTVAGEAGAAALAAKAATGEDMSGGQVKTAGEQGYSPGISALEAAQLADEAAQHTPRQMGEVVTQPGAVDAVAYDAAAAGWLANWRYLLNKDGVADEKIRFESKRLDHDEFQAWGWRHILAARVAAEMRGDNTGDIYMNDANTSNTGINDDGANSIRYDSPAEHNGVEYGGHH